MNEKSLCRINFSPAATEHLEALAERLISEIEYKESELELIANELSSRNSLVVMGDPDILEAA